VLWPSVSLTLIVRKSKFVTIRKFVTINLYRNLYTKLIKLCTLPKLVVIRLIKLDIIVNRIVTII
jgi:hypothetical protein